jgi:hypothetical protein
LGIDENTEWSGITVKPEWLAVSHYLFFSDEREAHISWHVMIAPHDLGKLADYDYPEEKVKEALNSLPKV